VDGSVNPVRDKEIIDTELLLKDIETVEKRIDKLKKQSKSADKAILRSLSIAEKIKEDLDKGTQARDLKLDEEEQEVMKEMMLLTSKPVVYVCNVDDSSVDKGNPYTEAFKKALSHENSEIIFVCAGIEAEIADFESKEERIEFLKELGFAEPGTNKVIKSAYSLLDLITYFTAGEKEVRAWTIQKGTKAPQAAGVIHSDFEKGFIRAEVIHYEDFVKLGSEAKVKEAGKMNVEGKEYVVMDGDVMHFRFNV